MKPTKNQHYCYSARRSKMLFESESKARNFIRFNKEDMERQGLKTPIRSYYCPVCCGWHITSNPNEKYFRTYKSEAERYLEICAR